MKQEQIKKLPCGVIGARYMDTIHHLPALKPILDTLEDGVQDFIFDVKVHMLMPGQYPCIPNWHYDFVPRNTEGEQDFSQVQTEYPLYLWLSGPPFTEFEDGRKVLPQQWLKMDQRTLHRGTVSQEHTWRLFIRAAHKHIAAKINSRQESLRRHTQVYLDAAAFRW